MHFIIIQDSSNGINRFNCSNQTVVMTTGNSTECVSQPYTGDLCLQLLSRTQSCSVGARNDVLVTTSSEQKSLESNLTIFLNLLGELLDKPGHFITSLWFPLQSVMDLSSVEMLYYHSCVSTHFHSVTTTLSNCTYQHKNDA